MTIRTVLAVGFLLTAGTWIFAGSYFTNRIQHLESQAAEISRRYVVAQGLLSETRAHVYRASVSVRDALLDPEHAPHYREEVEQGYTHAVQLLSQYVPVLDSTAERRNADQLRVEIAGLRAANLDVLSTDSRQWSTRASELLRMRIIPKRDAVIQVASDLQELNRQAYIGQQVETASLYREIQRGFWQTFGVAVLATLGIAVLSFLHVSRLERDLRAEQEKDARTAVELQRLSAALVNAQEEERRTIARELHDEIGQVLTVIKLELSHAQRQIALGAGRAELLDDARAITDRALHAVRDISHLLHPPLLDDLGLSAAVDWYVQSINRRQDLRVEFEHRNMSSRLPPSIEVALYRIVQEGLTNVLRHAQATRCEVSLVRFESAVVVTVKDDGVGFDRMAPTHGHDHPGLGLIGIRERIVQLGGRMGLKSEPGRGTLLIAELPVDVTNRATVVEARQLTPTRAGLNS